MDGPASRWKFVFGTMFLGASRWPPQIVIRYPTTANMGVAIFPVVEDGTGGWTDRINGKCLAKAVDVFDKVAKRRKFSKLFSFYSWSREDAIIEQLGGDPEDPSTFDESEIPAGRWFSPAEGLITVRALLTYMRSDGNGIENPTCVREDLEEFERVLASACENNVRWYLGLSA